MKKLKIILGIVFMLTSLLLLPAFAKDGDGSKRLRKKVEDLMAFPVAVEEGNLAKVKEIAHAYPYENLWTKQVSTSKGKTYFPREVAALGGYDELLEFISTKDPDFFKGENCDYLLSLA